jgi:DNA primase
MSYSASWEETIAIVKEQADIVQIVGEHVDLKRSGVRYLGLCPFHQEKTASFSVHPGQQFFYCFGCGASGDVFNFLMEYHHQEFTDALKTLAQRYQISLPEKQKTAREIEQEKRLKILYGLNHKAAARFHDQLLNSPQAGGARAYLQDRGISAQLISKYQLGYAPAPDQAGWNFLGGQFSETERTAAVEIGLLVSKEKGGTYDRFRGRIIFPILNRQGNVAGFGGRILDEGNPKYLNSPESIIYDKGRLLFGLYHQRDAIRMQRQVVLVEGNFDLLALLSHGLDTVVAPLGTALTREQVRLLKPLVDEVILLFDGDAAGQKAAERVITLFLAEQLSGRVARLPENHDPDSFVRSEGIDKLNAIIAEAEPLPEFVLDRIVARQGLTLDGKIRIIEELKPLLSAATSEQQRGIMASHFGSIVGVEPALLLAPSNQAGGVPAPSNERPLQRVAKLQPLAAGLKGLVRYMVLNPNHIAELEKAGIREVLSGTLGEVLFLQLKILFDQKSGSLQPEDLLSELPEGEERSLVAALLMEPPPENSTGPETGEPDQLGEILDWLLRAGLKKRSDQLVMDISEAQKNNDIKKINILMQEKMEVDNQLKAL